MKSLTILLLVFSFALFQSCDSGPKVIPTNSESEKEGSTGVFSGGDSHEGHDHDHDHDHAAEGAQSANSVHTVKVVEILPTEKYVYLFVEEGDEQFWIATSKMEVEIGKTYFYKDGLLKTNFESKEYNRIFDRMYLVSRLVPINHAATAEKKIPETNAKPIAPSSVDVEGSLKIAELVANPEKYAGKSIQISGVCTKVNPNIMDRNWLHLKDGSKDDYDLVVTSATAVPIGHTVTLTGTVAINKDFGAGYKYEIIVENGELVR